ncbi:MAG: ATP-binding protein [Agriterribacter sp.]
MKPTGRVTAAVENAFDHEQAFSIEYRIHPQRATSLRWIKAIGKMDTNTTTGDQYLAGAVIEITEQKQDDARKDDFIGMVSHELKTPLTSLSAIVQVLSGKFGSGEDVFVSSAFARANAQIKKMVTMINGFLNVSRLESGKILIEKTTVDVAALVQDVIKEIMISGLSRDIELIPPASLLYVEADYDKISSVVSNLITNAVKYSAPGHPIVIQCISIANSVQVSVTDHGIGIEKEDAAKIFQRYFRIENNYAARVGGFGIGLYLSAEIIHRHGGHIWVQSEPGKGSTFFFSLPMHGVGE